MSSWRGAYLRTREVFIAWCLFKHRMSSWRGA
jgi:hypothetical protein